MLEVLVVLLLSEIEDLRVKDVDVDVFFGFFIFVDSFIEFVLDDRVGMFIGLMEFLELLIMLVIFNGLIDFKELKWCKSVCFFLRVELIIFGLIDLFSFNYIGLFFIILLL